MMSTTVDPMDPQIEEELQTVIKTMELHFGNNSGEQALAFLRSYAKSYAAIDFLPEILKLMPDFFGVKEPITINNSEELQALMEHILLPLLRYNAFLSASEVGKE